MMRIHWKVRKGPKVYGSDLRYVEKRILGFRASHSLHAQRRPATWAQMCLENEKGGLHMKLLRIYESSVISQPLMWLGERVGQSKLRKIHSWSNWEMMPNKSSSEIPRNPTELVRTTLIRANPNQINSMASTTADENQQTKCYHKVGKTHLDYTRPLFSSLLIPPLPPLREDLWRLWNEQKRQLLYGCGALGQVGLVEHRKLQMF